MASFVPQVARNPFGILALILNIIFPGVGTLVAGIKDGSNLVRDIIIGVLQLLGIALFGLGWIWSVVWGVLIFLDSR